MQGLIAQGAEHGFKSDPDLDPDIASLQHTLIFGLRGVAAYADHAAILGQEDEAVYAFINEGLAATCDKSLTLNDWLGLVLKCGEDEPARHGAFGRGQHRDLRAPRAHRSSPGP